MTEELKTRGGEAVRETEEVVTKRQKPRLDLETGPVSHVESGDSGIDDAFKPKDTSPVHFDTEEEVAALKRTLRGNEIHDEAQYGWTVFSRNGVGEWYIRRKAKRGSGAAQYDFEKVQAGKKYDLYKRDRQSGKEYTATALFQEVVNPPQVSRWIEKSVQSPKSADQHALGAGSPRGEEVARARVISDTGPIRGSVDVSADAGAGGGGGETITPTEHVRVLAELKGAKDRELVLQREAVRKQHEYEALVRALALKSPEAALTLKTAHDAFPIAPNPTTDAERAQNAKHEKMFAAIAGRRFKIFQDGERVTDNTENIKRIGEAVLNFQKQPWYVRWGLSGIMAARDSALGAGVATLGSLAWFGTLAVPIATPLITGVAVGAGVRKFFHHSLETDNAIGRGKWFFHKYPHATSAILGALWAPQGFMAGLPGGSVLGTFLEQLSNTAGASLKSLLSLIGFSALGKKASLASPIAL